jgi:hypothetical protein
MNMKLQKFDAPKDKEFDTASYPGVGAFIDSDNCIRIIYKLHGVTMPSMAYLGALDPSCRQELFPESEPEVKQSSGVDQGLFLKALAICQKPELIKELV